jgi:peroxiredoxin
MFDRKNYPIMIHVMKNQKKMTLLLTILSIIFSIFWMGYTFLENKDDSQNSFSAPHKGFLAPDFTLSTLEDETAQLSDLKGHIVIVNIWASWCKPCQYEMPAMQKIYDKYSQEGLILLAVNNTYQDNLSDVISFVDENNLTFPILLDTNGEVSNLYQVQALPSTFFINQDGIIEDIIIGGPMSEALIESKILEMEANVSNP